MKMMLTGFVVDAICIAFTGFVGMICWNWFVPEIAASAPQITFATAVGLVFVCAIFAPSYKQYSLSDLEDGANIFFCRQVYSQLMNDISRPFGILFMGWIAHVLLF